MGISNKYFSTKEAITIQNFGEFLRDYRKNKKVTQNELARAIKLTYKTLLRYEKSQTNRYSFNEIVSIDNALGADGELIAEAWREWDRDL